MSATGSTFSPNVPIWFQCHIDGAPCNTGIAHAVGPAFPGWISLLRHRDVEGEDNGMHYTWCKRLPGAGGGPIPSRSGWRPVYQGSEAARCSLRQLTSTLTPISFLTGCL